MLGISYGELLLLIGATAALIGPKDLPKIAKTAGRLAGRAIGHVQIARGQFDNILQQSHARQVHKELQDALAQLEAIRYEVRSLSMMNPGPMTRRLIDSDESVEATNPNSATGRLIDNEDSTAAVESASQKLDKELKTVVPTSKDHGTPPGRLTNLHGQAIMHERVAKMIPEAGASSSNEDTEKLSEDVGNFVVLPISAESAGLLPPRTNDLKGSDVMLEAILEAEVAANAKHFVETQVRSE